MATEHATGAAEGTRQGCYPIVHSLKVNFNSTVNRKFLHIRATPQNPVRLRMRELGITAFNAGTLNQYRLGTASAGAQLLALRNTPAANADTPLTLLQAVFTASFDLWVGTGLTGTAATTGEMWLEAELIDLNPNDVNPNAIP